MKNCKKNNNGESNTKDLADCKGTKDSKDCGQVVKVMWYNEKPIEKLVENFNLIVLKLIF